MSERPGQVKDDAWAAYEANPRRSYPYASQAPKNPALPGGWIVGGQWAFAPHSPYYQKPHPIDPNAPKKPQRAATGIYRPPLPCPANGWAEVEAFLNGELG